MKLWHVILIFGIVLGLVYYIEFYIGLEKIYSYRLERSLFIFPILAIVFALAKKNWKILLTLLGLAIFFSVFLINFCTSTEGEGLYSHLGSWNCLFVLIWILFLYSLKKK